ncbi:MAG: ribonuclease HII [Nitrospiraceae bacterium]|nr:ribonuclease HII [Nitrospiraceae bacterium]
MDLYRYDASLRRKGFAIIAGVDEAGRGPIAGPVVAAAAVLPPSARIAGLRDSKQVPEKERAVLFWEVLCAAEALGVGIVDHERIDDSNILKATKEAMQLALQDLRMTPQLLVIDAVALPSVPVEQISPFKAESKSASVAAASIVAKYVRDAIMLRYDELYPVYNFRKHKGYCTREHLEKISRHGLCPIHRKSYRKVMTMNLF